MTTSTRKSAGYESGADRVSRAFITNLRHDLKTPLSVIVGYCEFLIEVAGQDAPLAFVANLHKILSASNDLISVVNEILDPTISGATGDENDLKDMEGHLRKKMHKPLNEVIGLSEMLLKDAEYQGKEAYIPDLQNILIAAKRFMSLIHEVILLKLENEGNLSAQRMGEASTPFEDVMRTIRPLKRTSGGTKMIGGGTILVVDDVDMNRDLIARQLESQGYRVELAEDGLQALGMLKDKDFDLILLDIMMPNMNGIEVLQRLKKHEIWKYIPVIMISAMEEMDSVARCIQMGAEDYLSKPFESVILMARISASLEKKRLRDNEISYLAHMKEIVKQQNYEIAEAASYVKSLLPPCISEGAVRTDWRFHPSTSLGGDSFGYHWLVEDHFVIYLLDVSGHGVGAALFSISILNMIRSGALPEKEYYEPGRILSTLNNTFPMENHYNMYFSLWYGVYNPSIRRLTYASAGHPPALLLTGEFPDNPEITELETKNLVMGITPNHPYQHGIQKLDGSGRLYVFSDGAFEIPIQKDGERWGFKNFKEFMSQMPPKDMSKLDHLWNHIQRINSATRIEDDFSVLEVVFEQ